MCGVPRGPKRGSVAHREHCETALCPRPRVGSRAGRVIARIEASVQGDGTSAPSSRRYRTFNALSGPPFFFFKFFFGEKKGGGLDYLVDRGQAENLIKLTKDPNSRGDRHLLQRAAAAKQMRLILHTRRLLAAVGRVQQAIPVKRTPPETRRVSPPCKPDFGSKSAPAHHRDRKPASASPFALPARNKGPDRQL